MAEVGTEWPQGTPCWVSLMARDPEGAQRFYGPLLGWDFTAGPEHLGPYALALVEGTPVAGIGAVPPRSRLASDWTVYFAADSADDVAQRVREYGGTVAVGPLDADHAGRLAIASDLFGAVFGIWEGVEHPGWGRYRRPGAVSWCELACGEVRGSAAFYAGTFGLAAVETGPEEAELRTGGRSVASIVRGWEDVFDLPGAVPPRPHWTVFFAVADLAKTVHQAAELGGALVGEPHATRHGSVATLRDPEGAEFSVVERAAA
jgi:predicted enzyme related to lactoylglutathione lyase